MTVHRADQDRGPPPRRRPPGLHQHARPRRRRRTLLRPPTSLRTPGPPPTLESTTPRNGAAGGQRGTATAGSSRRLGDVRHGYTAKFASRPHRRPASAPAGKAGCTRCYRVGAMGAAEQRGGARWRWRAHRLAVSLPTASRGAASCWNARPHSLAHTHATSTQRVRTSPRHGHAYIVGSAIFCRRTHGTGCTPQPRSDGGRPLH